MDIRDFLNDLIFYFPPDRRPEDVPRLLEVYVEDLLREISKWKGYEPDYNKLLSYIRTNHKYRKTPTVQELINFLPNGMKPIQKEYNPTGREGDQIEFIKNGMVYQFTVVANIWDNVKSISQVQREVARANAKPE